MAGGRYISTIVIIALFVGMGIAIADSSSPIPEFSINATSLGFGWNYQGVLNLSLNTSYYSYTNITIPNDTVVYDNLQNGINTYTDNLNATLNISVANSSTFMLTGDVNSSHGAGRYTGSMTVYNETTPSGANATISLTLDVPVTFNASNIGTFEANVTNSTSQTFYFDVTNVTGYTGGIEVNLSDISSSATVTLYDNDSTQLATGTVNSSNSLEYKLPGAETTSEYWYIVIQNSTTQSDLTFNGTIEAKMASFVEGGGPSGGGIYLGPGTQTYDDNVGFNKTIQTGFYINNTAGYTLSFNSVTNSTNLTDGSGNFILMDSNVTGTNLGSGTSRYFEVNYTLNTSLTGNTAGIYRGWFFFNTSNGYPYDTFNLTIEFNLTNLLDTTVSDVTNNTVDSNWTYSNSTINITLTPGYANGTVVSGLGDNNFSVSISHVNGGAFTCVVDLTNETVVDSGSNYNITAKVPATSSCGYSSAVLGGNYTVNVSVTDDNTGGTNTGSGTWNGTLYVNETALNVTGLQSGSVLTSISKTVGGTFDIDPKAFNYGSRAAQGVNVTQSTGSCVNKTAGPDTIYIGDMSAWDYDGQLNGSATSWTFNATSNGTCTITLTGEALGTSWQAKTHSISVTVTTSGNGGNGGDGDGTTDDTTTQPTLEHELTITEYTNQIEVEQGKSGSASITVKNTGDYTETVSLSIDGIDSGWWTSPNSKELSKDSTHTFNINFNIPESAEVKSYGITFTASSPDTSTSASSTLKVTPSNATQEEIMQNLTNLTSLIEDIGKELNSTRAAGYNVSTAEDFLKDAKDKLKEAKAYADVEDWFNAYQLLDDIKSAIESAQNALGESKEETGKGLEIPSGAMVIAAIAILGAIAYLALPAGKGYSRGGYSFGGHHWGDKKGRVLKSKLKEKLRKLKEKLKSKRKKGGSQSYHYSFDF